MTQTEFLATKRLALLAKRDLIIKQNQELNTALTTHSDSLTALCQEMTTLLLEAEAKIASQAETILTAQNTIRSQQADLNRCQAELASIRREMTTYRAQTPSPVEEETSLRRGKSLQRAMQKQRKDQFVHQYTLETQIEKLTAQLTTKDEQIRTLQAKWQDTHLQNLKLMEECHAQRTELHRLRPTLPAPPLPRRRITCRRADLRRSVYRQAQPSCTYTDDQCYRRQSHVAEKSTNCLPADSLPRQSRLRCCKA